MIIYISLTKHNKVWVVSMHKYYKVYKQNIDKTKKKKIFETNKNVMFVECVNLSVRITIMTKDITIITNTYLDRII